MACPKVAESCDYLSRIERWVNWYLVTLNISIEVEAGYYLPR